MFITQHYFKNYKSGSLEAEYKEMRGESRLLHKTFYVAKM